MVPWSFGPLVLWSRGPLVPWSFGPVVPWSSSEVLYNHVCSCQLRGGVFNITFTWQAFQNHVCCFQFGAKVSLIASASGISRAKAFKRMSDAFTFCKNSKVRKKMAYETLQRSRVELRRRTLALPTRKPSSRRCLKAQTLCNNRKVRKKWLMKLCKDRVSNFDAGLWHFLQENLPAVNASKPKPFATTEKFEKNGL